MSLHNLDGVFYVHNLCPKDEWMKPVGFDFENGTESSFHHGFTAPLVIDMLQGAGWSKNRLKGIPINWKGRSKMMILEQKNRPQQMNSECDFMSTIYVQELNYCFRTYNLLILFGVPNRI